MVRRARHAQADYGARTHHSVGRPRDDRRVSGTPLWVTITLPAIGYIAAVVTELLRGRVERRGAREAHDAERAAVVAERRDLYEIDTLNNAIEALNSLARLAMRVHLADVKAARDTKGLYAAHLLPDAQLDEDFRLGHMRVGNLGRTLLDDGCRAAIRTAQDTLGKPSRMLKSDPQDAEAVMNGAQAKASEALDVLAERLRAVYAGDNSRGGV